MSPYKVWKPSNRVINMRAKNAKVIGQSISVWLSLLVASQMVAAVPLPSTIVTWGASRVNGAYVTPDVPGLPRTDPLLDVVSVCADYNVNLAIRADGTVGCWGDCSTFSPYLPQLTNVTAISIARPTFLTEFLTVQ